MRTVNPRSLKFRIILLVANLICDSEALRVDKDEKAYFDMNKSVAKFFEKLKVKALQ